MDEKKQKPRIDEESIFNECLNSSILNDTYGLSSNQIKNVKYSDYTYVPHPVIELIKVIIRNRKASDVQTYNLVKNIKLQ